MDPSTSIGYTGLFGDIMTDVVAFIAIPILAWTLITK